MGANSDMAEMLLPDRWMPPIVHQKSEGRTPTVPAPSRIRPFPHGVAIDGENPAEYIDQNKNEVVVVAIGPGEEPVAACTETGTWRSRRGGQLWAAEGLERRVA